MTQKAARELIHSIKVDEEVWLELIRLKYAGRYHSTNEPLRLALGLSAEDRSPVKNYSDESSAGYDGMLARSPAAYPTRP